jgi:hypothetical protein
VRLEDVKELDRPEGLQIVSQAHHPQRRQLCARVLRDLRAKALVLDGSAYDVDGIMIKNATKSAKWFVSNTRRDIIPEKSPGVPSV